MLDQVDFAVGAAADSPQDAEVALLNRRSLRCAVVTSSVAARGETALARTRRVVLRMTFLALAIADIIGTLSSLAGVDT